MGANIGHIHTSASLNIVKQAAEKTKDKPTVKPDNNRKAQTRVSENNSSLGECDERPVFVFNLSDIYIGLCSQTLHWG